MHMGFRDVIVSFSPRGKETTGPMVDWKIVESNLHVNSSRNNFASLNSLNSNRVKCWNEWIFRKGQNLFGIKRRNHKESMFNNGWLVPRDRDIRCSFLFFIIFEKGRISQARRASYCPSTVKSSSIGGPEFTPRTLGTWDRSWNRSNVSRCTVI